MYLKQHNALASIPAGAWNRLDGTDSPFLRYEFLYALEKTNCVCPKTGWIPQHLALYEFADEPDSLIGAIPLYIKNHSYGEYIFDWAWANAYDRSGLNYYPKLSVAIPFTPVTGKRLLVSGNRNREAISKLLIDGALSVAEKYQASSIHWLFTTKEESALLQQHRHLFRTGYQFHWHNNNYNNFDHFLESLSAQKRKKIKRERRQVRDAGITMEVITGKEIRDDHWDRFYGFYTNTIQKHGAIPYLNREFFHEIGRTMPDSVVLVFAHQDDKVIAGSLNYKSDNTLYGRYWGSLGSYHSLHFETCYYRAIEFCIENRLTRFEAGAQGGHKLSRGFLPVEIYSAHWLDHPEFNRAVADYIEREQNDIEYQIDELNEHSPFKHKTGSGNQANHVSVK